MRIQKSYGIALVLVLALGVAGCSLFDSRDPVGPINSSGDVSQLGNFWVKDGPGGKYEVSTKEGEMEVSVPEEGQYMLTYTTMYGTFYIVFETLDAATLFIGLHSGDIVKTAYIQEGEIVDVEDLEVIFQTGLLTAYLLPGRDDEGEDGNGEDEDDPPSEWYDMFDGGFMLIMLIIDGESVVDDTEEGEESEEGEGGGPWEVAISAPGGGGAVKPEGINMVPNGASISIQFLPVSGNFSDITVTVDGAEVPLQQLGGKPGKQKGHLVIHDVDQDLTVEATFSG